MDGKFHFFALTARFISWLYEMVHRLALAPGARIFAVNARVKIGMK
jgi:hypothetical protein